MGQGYTIVKKDITEWMETVFRTWNCWRKKKRKFLVGSGGMLPLKILKVETKICAIWGIQGANLKKSSTPKFIMNISFVPSICIHRSIILIFIKKKKDVCLLILFPTENIFSMIFDFHFRQNPRFRDEFQALCLTHSHPKAVHINH